MASQEQQDAAPRLCSKGCGFFSNAATMGMCSKCFREEQNSQENAKAALAASAEAQQVPVAEAPAHMPVPSASPSASVEVAPASMSAVAEGSSSALAPMDFSPAFPSSASKPNRCQQCRKKVGLTGFSCKCGMMFCSQHRYAEAHNCTFDYKTAEREKLAANNPLVQASKVERI